MKIFAPVALLVVATVLLTVSLLASTLAPPTGLDSRDIFVFALGSCALLLFGLAIRRLLRVHRNLMTR